MKFFKQPNTIKHFIIWTIMLFLIVGFTAEPLHVTAAENPDEIMLGSFWTSEEDTSDTLYVSFDGINFKSIGDAYTDSDPTSASNSIITDSPSLTPRPGTYDDRWTVNTLHDPGLMYKDGWFWMVSRYDPYIDGEKRFAPMLGYSKDLVNWSYPNSGSSENISLSVLPYAKDGTRTNTDWDSVAPDLLLDDDGTVWITVCIGYYGHNHGDEGNNSMMSPYLIKATGLAPGCTEINTRDDKMQYPSVTYSEAVPINLPDEDLYPNRIDGSLYKENGKYYLSIKRKGVTNEIWSIDDLNDCQDSSKWTLVCSDVVTGFEGPFLTKYNNTYYYYTDKLADFPPDNYDNKTGIFVSRSTGLDQPWSENIRIKATDVNGNELATRHGSVITITDPDAIAVIMKRYKDCGYTYDPNTDKPEPLDLNGWFYANGNNYWYDDGILARSKEVYDPSSDAWYWFDADATMAKDKDVYLPPTANSNGKWVRYDSQGHMRKGEDYRYGAWYWFDLITGEMFKGFINIPEADNPDGKWVYYDDITGKMLYGEQCIYGNWYYFDDWTGKMAHGELLRNNNWYLYDDITGIMCKGSIYRNNNWYYYDPITGIMQYGEVCRDGGNWYLYDPFTGVMQKGEVLRNNNWYYYDEITGIMQKGKLSHNGKWYYYDEITGIMQYGTVTFSDGHTEHYDLYTGELLY